ncbi:MAG: hypothetical protein L3J24_02870 [Xanthomonadales bacterium]|nr:hypothetical protein [Xanthomonadales bacterium]
MSNNIILKPSVQSSLRINPEIEVVRAGEAATAFTDPGDATKNEKMIRQLGKQMRPLLSRLQASQSHSILLVVQALDAAGKDSMIRALFSAQDPAIIKVASFKSPSKIESRHDFLWRTNKQLPARGEICIFNRSYYEEVLVVRVHESFLNSQYPKGIDNPADLWPLRYQAISAYEKHLAASGTLILKFWLNVSVAEQKRRFLSRLDRPKKRWKFNPTDVKEMAYRTAYDEAFADMVNATSTDYAPWFMIPADDKPRARMEVGKIVVEALQGMGLEYPQLDPEIATELSTWQSQLRE